MSNSTGLSTTSMRNEQQAQAMWDYERDLTGQTLTLAGVDEVGRGCIAGPVFAGAVILGGTPRDWVGVKDSKQIAKKRREELYDIIKTQSIATGIGIATVEEIEQLNILQASRVAMGRAIENLQSKFDILVVDGIYGPLPEQYPYITVVEGDALCLSIAAASILAKVERDRYMEDMASLYPEYGFDHNAGYGTKEHLSAIALHGITPLHRRSFAPVKRIQQLELGL